MYLDNDYPFTVDNGMLQGYGVFKIFNKRLRFVLVLLFKNIPKNSYVIDILSI